MLYSAKTSEIHKSILVAYKERLDYLENIKHEEDEEPFERSYLHNTIYLHNLWFEQLLGEDIETKSPLFEEILERREATPQSFETWMNEFADAAKPNGWAIWGWSYPQKTFVGFPIRGDDDGVPLGVTPLLVIDCWEHSYIYDFDGDFGAYLTKVWKSINWKVVEERHQELATMFGFNLK